MQPLIKHPSAPPRLDSAAPRPSGSRPTSSAASSTVGSGLRTPIPPGPEKPLPALSLAARTRPSTPPGSRVFYKPQVPNAAALLGTEARAIGDDDETLCEVLQTGARPKAHGNEVPATPLPPPRVPTSKPPPLPTRAISSGPPGVGVNVGVGVVPISSALPPPPDHSAAVKGALAAWQPVMSAFEQRIGDLERQRLVAVIAFSLSLLLSVVALLTAMASHGSSN